MSQSELASQIDPMVGSIGNLMGVAFGKTNSPGYQMALRLAQTASRYAEANVDGAKHHFAVFGRTRDDAARCLALLEMCRGWKSFRVFVQGRLVGDTWEARWILGCYSKAIACDDWRAHCHRIIDDPRTTHVRNRVVLTIGLQLRLSDEEPPRPDRYVFPCAHLLSNFHFMSDHPSSYRDQIQAGAVTRGCDWCPLFDPDGFRKLAPAVDSFTAPPPTCSPGTDD